MRRRPSAVLRPLRRPDPNPSPTPSWLSVPGNPLLRWPPPPPPKPPPSAPPLTDTSAVSAILRDSTLPPAALRTSLDQAGLRLEPDLLETLVRGNSISAASVPVLYDWACATRPDFRRFPSLLAFLVDRLGSSRQFASAWRLLVPRLGEFSSPPPLSACAALIRRYARAGMPQSAVRTFEFLVETDQFPNLNATEAFEILLDALCKEGQVAAAADYFDKFRLSADSAMPVVVPSIRAYNILLNGWFRARKLRKAERLWAEMKRDNVRPTVVTYGTLVEGYCRMRRPEQAMELLSQMKTNEIEVNVIVYNPIIDSLAEAGRFKDAANMLEKMPLYSLQPNISTFNSLVKGYCKAGDLKGASKALKSMIERGIVPTAMTYNYFFKCFAKTGRIEEGMNLYTKMIGSGYVPDRLTYHLLLKMLCEKERLDLAVQIVKEMNARGFDKDLATSTMLLHLLGRLGRLEEACREFEGMVGRGLVPQYITYKMLLDELKKVGLFDLARKVNVLMDGLSHSTKLPDTFRRESDRPRDERSQIMRKAQLMSDVLKTCRDPRELRNRKEESAVARANRLIEDIKRRVYAA